MRHLESSLDWIKAFYESAIEWWGESWYDGENLKERLELVQHYGNHDDKRILELGAGTGETAVYLCDRGYSVLAVDVCKKNVELMNEMRKTRPSLRVVDGDFLTVNIEEAFPTVCMFETFGLGSDKDQRELLKRIQRHWLTDNGVLILDVYHPFGPIKAAGTKQELDKLDNVPGSVDMTEYSYYDGIKNRWIDVWEPRNDPGKSRTQSIRCYSPADLMLLMEGTGLVIHKILYKKRIIAFEQDEINIENAFDDSNREYSYSVIVKKNRP